MCGNQNIITNKQTLQSVSCLKIAISLEIALTLWHPG